MKAKEINELAKAANLDIDAMVMRIDKEIVAQAKLGFYYLDIDHTEYNDMSTDYWKTIIRHYKDKGLEARAWCSIITIRWRKLK